MENVLDTRIPMMGQPVNALGAFAGGAQAAQQIQGNALDMEDRDRKRKIEAMQMLAQGVNASDDPATAYPHALKVWRGMGNEVPDWLPTEWNEDAGMAMKIFAMTDDERTGVERLIERLPENERHDAIRTQLKTLPQAEGPDFISAGGSVLRTDPQAGTATEVFRAPEKADHPSGVDEYLFAIGNDGFEGTYQDWLAQKPGGKRDIRNDPQGIPRYVDSADPVFPGVEPKPAKPSSTQEKIDLLTSQGVDQETATAIATGRYTTSRHPVSGQAQIVDKATGQVIGPMPGQMPQGAPQGAGHPTPPLGGQQPETLYDKAGSATGIVPGLQEFSTDVFGQLPGALGETFQFPDTVEDRQTLRTAAGNLVRALSVNPRMPVAEINRIRDQIKIEPSARMSAEGLQSRMRSIAESLGRNIGTQRAVAADQSMPAEARRSAAENSAAMEAFLSELGVPVDAGPRSGNSGQPGGNLPRPASEQDYRSLPPGAVYMAPDGTMRRKPE